MLIDEYLFVLYNMFRSCRLAVGHALSYGGGDAYGYMDRFINILPGTVSSCFLVKRQVEDKDKCRPD